MNSWKCCSTSFGFISAMSPRVTVLAANLPGVCAAARETRVKVRTRIAEKKIALRMALDADLSQTARFVGIIQSLMLGKEKSAGWAPFGLATTAIVDIRSPVSLPARAGS